MISAGLGSSPFSSQASSIRNSPDPGAENSDVKVAGGLDLGLRFNTKEEQWQDRTPTNPEPGKGTGPGPYFPGTLQVKILIEVKPWTLFQYSGTK